MPKTNSFNFIFTWGGRFSPKKALTLLMFKKNKTVTTIIEKINIFNLFDIVKFNIAPHFVKDRFLQVFFSFNS